MKNFLQKGREAKLSIKETSLMINRIESHIYRGELGPAAALLASAEDELDRLQEDISFPTGMVFIGMQLGFLTGGKLRGRIPGTLLGGALGWLYGQHVASHTRQDIDTIKERIEDLHHLLVVQAQRLSEKKQ